MFIHEIINKNTDYFYFKWHVSVVPQTFCPGKFNGGNQSFVNGVVFLRFC